MKIKKLIAVVILVIICSNNFITAQSPNWLWAKRAGGTSNDRGYSVSSDASGNVFMTGNFASPTITFGSTSLTNLGGHNIFIVKYNASGNMIWAKSAGDWADDYGNCVSSDLSGNVYMTGYFTSPTITFDTTTLTNTGFENLFMVKYDSNGNVLWARNDGGSASSEGTSVSTDDSGNVFMTGYFSGPTMTFGSTTLTNAGGQNFFIVKYDANGNVLWAKCSGGISNISQGNSVSSDASGNVFVTGYFGSTITFGSGPSLYTLNTTGSRNLFIVKYNTNGNVIWAKSSGGISNSYGNCVSTDAIGNVFMTGYFNGPLITFGTTTLNNSGSSGSDDVFIVKYNASGNVLWAMNTANATDEDRGNSVSNDASGNVFMTGYFKSQNITFGAYTLSNNTVGFSNIFLVKYDQNGNVLWAKSAGGSTRDDQGTSVSANANGTLFLTGYFNNSAITFGSTTLTNSNPTPNFSDVFIAKLDASTTGVEELTEHLDNSIVPNPFTSQTSIIFKEDQKQLTIKVFDLLGKEIKTDIFSGKEYILKKGSMKAGIYFVKLVDEFANITNIKIVVK